MPFLERAGARIYHEDSGGGGVPVVFSHGLLMDHEMFEPQVTALRGEFRCVTWDERGHGETASDGSFTYWDSARDLLALLDHLAIEKAFLVGMSQGGYLSLRAALLAPERVLGLALIDSQAMTEDPQLRPSYEALVQAWIDNGPSAEVATIAASIIVGPADHAPWIEKWLSRPAEWVGAPMEALFNREDLTERLAEIAAPAIVIHGEDDPAISLERGRALCEGLARCDGFVAIPGAGHASNLSHPGVVNETLRDFFHRHYG